MAFRYYAMRTGTEIWLDNDAQLSKPEFSSNLSAPNVGKAKVTAGLSNNPIASDGQKVWDKWNTLIFVEEDNSLIWVGICVDATPSTDGGIDLQFIGTPAWLQKVPYTLVYRVWRTNVFDVVRHLINHSKLKSPNLDYVVGQHDSTAFVGDVQPPERPKQPPRNKGEKKADYLDSNRYKNWKTADTNWVRDYGDRRRFEIAWWEAPYVGEEIDALAREAGFEYRERYAWRVRDLKTYSFYFDFADDIVRRRTDIALIDGLNIAKLLEPKAADRNYANRVIALGAGEGPKMRRSATQAVTGTRLYQAEFVQFKSLRSIERLNNRAKFHLRGVSGTDPIVGTVVAWDIDDMAPMRTLLPGDEIKLESKNTNPNINQWVRVISITRKPEEALVYLTLEVTS